MARLAGATELEWDAEPFALGFYLAMGGVVIGEVPSAAEAGRMLPRMRLKGRAYSRRSTRPIRPNGGRGSA